MRIGPTEIIIVLIIVILIFGIGKLPELGKSLGQGLRSFKSAQEDLDKQVKSVKSTIENKPVEKTEKPAAEGEPAKKDLPVVPPPSDEDE
ncbi:twin-arginine translocase TatA/TatE family subunit [Dehalogenimonas sp. THU2]|jgi:sec-independent protein translocase protein TatA|uniref:twin-arginine translocase TatA/TatE family subunit n=1 Tax=Dehalogenimonas sp. THU2 TaxID=3151121 RepID=UPI0032182677